RILFAAPGIPIGAHEKQSTEANEHTIALLDADGAAIVETPLVAVFRGPCSPIEMPATLATGIADFDGDARIAAIEIRRLGKTIGRLERADAPAVEAVTASVEPGADKTDDLLSVDWKGNGIGYIVSY